MTTNLILESLPPEELLARREIRRQHLLLQVETVLIAAAYTRPRFQVADLEVWPAFQLRSARRIRQRHEQRETISAAGAGAA